MEIQKCKGIILQSRESGEADTIATIFTGEYGKRTFIFKGLRKSKRRSRSAVEPGTALQLVYYHHENKPVTVAGEFTLLQDILQVRDNLEKILNVYFMLEMVDKTSASGDPAQAIYNLLYSALATMKTTTYPLHITLCFTLHLLHTLGILPDIDRCSFCGRVLSSSFRIHIDDFNTICHSCDRSNPASNRSNTIPLEVLGFVNDSFCKKFSDISHEKYNESDLLHFLFSISLFVEHYFHTKIKSKSLLFSDYEI